ncbi:MAG: lipopolysaccharide transport periplasmic protein LptA [Woeseiaceae bacterium]|nr:lipopolysaccharide transport periplasmic protein LptA [Woeseiaceae bacterium]
MKFRPAILLLLPIVAAAQLQDTRLPITVDAEKTDYDGKAGLLIFRSPKVTQGNLVIEADEGRATELNFDDSTWTFSGNVIIDVENGHIESDAADLRFTENQLLSAQISGSPATFELKRAGSEEITYAEAGKLRYDLVAGTVEFSDNATITEGGNQISSDLLVYDIAAQRIQAQGSDDAGRVRITYTPPEAQPEEDEPEPGEDGP